MTMRELFTIGVFLIAVAGTIGFGSYTLGYIHGQIVVRSEAAR